MRDARMIGMLLELLLEDRRGLERGGVSLVGERLRGGQVNRVEDLRFVVLRIALGDDLERIGERLHALSVRPARIEVVILPDGLDEVQLALGLAARSAGALERLFRALRLRGIRPGGERVADQRRGNAPAGDRAVRIARQRFLECALALAEPEGMQERDTALEDRLRRRQAGVRERNLAELLGRAAAFLSPRCGANGKESTEQNRATEHGKPPWGMSLPLCAARAPL